MSLQLAILSSIALMVDSTEASPFWRIDINKRVVEEETTTTKKVAKAAVETEPENKFSNKPTSKATTTKKATSAKPSAKPTSAVTPSSAIIPSAQVPSSIVSSPSPTPTPVVPPLMVSSSPSSDSSRSSSSATPSATASADTSGGGVSGGAIGGIVAAVIIVILGAVAYLFVRRRKNNKQRNRHISNKPDPFTMGYGSDQAFQQPQMQQTYQHQYGVQPSIAVTSPTSPTSPYYNNASNTQFHDANNHIIADSMTPAIVPPHQDQQYQQYQSQLQPQPQQAQFQQQQVYQPQQQPEVYQPQVYQPEQLTQPIPNAVDSNNTLVGGVAAVGVAGAAAAGAGTGADNNNKNNNNNNNTLLAPTQAGSVGVFHVAATYTPTLSDEIDIQTGDQVEVLVEYDDGWCQGINLTRGNVKGVFPKHCIDYASGASITSSSSNNEVDRVKRVSSMYIA